MSSKFALVCILLSSVSGKRVHLQAVDDTPGISLKQVTANGLIFDCRVAGWGGKAGNVLLLHGFPEWSEMYNELMQSMAANGFSSVACDQRGYSLGASPTNIEEYHYDNMRDDVFAVADAVGFDKFHVVAHDHGAVLGWYSAGSDRGEQRFLSFTALSIPHIDAFSKALDPTSDEADQDPDQQVASQYFTMFVDEDSATSHDAFWCGRMAPAGSKFENCHDFQHALWWYNGAILGAGVLALPRVMPAAELSGTTRYMRNLWGEDDIGTHHQTSPAGPVSMPVLYVCGSTDDSILCNKPYALKTRDYCPAGYTYLEVNCGHDLLSCEDQTETQRVIGAIVNHLEGAH